MELNIDWEVLKEELARREEEGIPAKMPMKGHTLRTPKPAAPSPEAVPKKQTEQVTTPRSSRPRTSPWVMLRDIRA